MKKRGKLYAQIKALTEEVSMLRQSMDQSKQAIDDLLSEIKSLGKKLEEKENRIADLEQQLSDVLEYKLNSEEKAFCIVVQNKTKKEFDAQERKTERENRSVPIMTRIYCKIKFLSKDMKKAVTYMLNQWESLRNFILDGRGQLSYSVETYQTELEVCQNIGSEIVAEPPFHVFFDGDFKLNKLKEEPYMEMLFNSLCTVQMDCERPLPCFYKQ